MARLLILEQSLTSPKLCTRKKRQVSVDGTLWVDKIRAEHDNAVKDQAQAVDNLVISTKRNRNEYDV